MPNQFDSFMRKEAAGQVFRPPNQTPNRATPAPVPRVPPTPLLPWQRAKIKSNEQNRFAGRQMAQSDNRVQQYDSQTARRPVPTNLQGFRDENQNLQAERQQEQTGNARLSRMERQGHVPTTGAVTGTPLKDNPYTKFMTGQEAGESADMDKVRRQREADLFQAERDYRHHIATGGQVGTAPSQPAQPMAPSQTPELERKYNTQASIDARNKLPADYQQRLTAQNKLKAEIAAGNQSNSMELTERDKRSLARMNQSRAQGPADMIPKKSSAEDALSAFMSRGELHKEAVVQQQPRRPVARPVQRAPVVTRYSGSGRSAGSRPAPNPGESMGLSRVSSFDVRNGGVKQPQGPATQPGFSTNQNSGGMGYNNPYVGPANNTVSTGGRVSQKSQPGRPDAGWGSVGVDVGPNAAKRQRASPPTQFTKNGPVGVSIGTQSQTGSKVGSGIMEGGIQEDSLTPDEVAQLNTKGSFAPEIARSGGAYGSPDKQRQDFDDAMRGNFSSSNYDDKQRSQIAQLRNKPGDMNALYNDWMKSQRAPQAMAGSPRATEQGAA